MTSYISNINISDRTLNEIKKAIGFPVIQDEFSFIMTEEQIKELVIAPALETFYTYFPLMSSMSIASTGSEAVAEADAPENTIFLMRRQFVPQSSALGGASLLQQGMFYGNPFYSASQVLSRGSYGSGGNYGTPFSYGNDLNTYQRRFYSESVESSNKVYYIKFDEQTNKVSYKSSIPGTFYFEFGLWSNDTEKIPMHRRQAFIKYAQGLLMKEFANILSFTESDLPVSIDKDYLSDQADKKMEESLQYFREASFIPVMR